MRSFESISNGNIKRAMPPMRALAISGTLDDKLLGVGATGDAFTIDSDARVKLLAEAVDLVRVWVWIPPMLIFACGDAFHGRKMG